MEGLRIALDHIDEIIHLIRSSQNDAEARTGLMEQFKLTEIQQMQSWRCVCVV